MGVIWCNLHFDVLYLDAEKFTKLGTDVSEHKTLWAYFVFI